MDKTLRKAVLKNSYAKINLYLEVLGKREDGFHEIRTVFSEIDLHDELSFVLTKGSEIKVWCNEGTIATKDNLVYKVAVSMKDKYNVMSGVEVRINKQIPVSAGLGGGSSNAACAITSLNDLWNLNLNDFELHELATQIGSDVNFFLIGGTALGTGRGERIKPVGNLDFDMILLVKPDFGIESGFAYSLVEQYGDDGSWQELLTDGLPMHCFNRLEKPLRKEFMELDEMIKYLEDNGAVKAMISGSGSTVIGFYDDKRTCDEHYHYYQSKGVWSYQTNTKRRNT